MKSSRSRTGVTGLALTGCGKACSSQEGQGDCYGKLQLARDHKPGDGASRTDPLQVRHPPISIPTWGCASEGLGIDNLAGSLSCGEGSQAAEYRPSPRHSCVCSAWKTGGSMTSGGRRTCAGPPWTGVPLSLGFLSLLDPPCPHGKGQGQGRGLLSFLSMYARTHSPLPRP